MLSGRQKREKRRICRKKNGRKRREGVKGVKEDEVGLNLKRDKKNDQVRYKEN